MKLHVYLIEVYILPEREEIESLATDPVIWHGNGAGKIKN